MRKTWWRGTCVWVAVLVGGAAHAPSATAQHRSCWGQASQVYARMGEMGEHASQQSNPREGLGNLARSLYDLGVIEDPTLSALGAYLAGVLGLEIDACETDPAAVIAAERHATVHASCWGQASAVFARAGQMGAHASQFDTPRLGLRNLARALYDLGVIRAPTMSALGAFVADELGLTIDACQ